MLLIAFCFAALTGFAQDPPVTPTSFNATPSTTAYEILLTWTEISDNETYFFIQRTREDNGEYWSYMAGANQTNYTDHDVEPNVTYQYSIYAANDFGTSEEISTITTLFRQAPSVPTQVTASTGPQVFIELSFRDNSDIETGFEIRHSSDPSVPDEYYNGEVVYGGGIGATVTTYLNDGPYGISPEFIFYQPGATAYIKVRAFILDQGHYIYSDFSPIVSAVTNGVPETPTNFTATPEAGGIRLHWKDNSTHEARYYVARFSGTFNPLTDVIAVLSADDTTYLDTFLQPEVDYTYWLMAVDYYEYQEWPVRGELFLQDPLRVAVTTANMPGTPPAPYELTAEGITPDTIRIQFLDTGNSETYYEIQAGLSPGGPFDQGTFQVEGTGEGNYVELRMAPFQAATTYYFRVRGVVELGSELIYGVFSEVVSATTLDDAQPPAAPVAKWATFLKPDSFTANWSAVEGADHYEIDVFYIKHGHKVYLWPYQEKIVRATSFRIYGTKKNRKYAYLVRAVNEDGESPDSNTILVGPVKNLILLATCSNNPDSTRRWKVLNLNPFDVPVIWRGKNPQTGTFMATPGESFFTTMTVAGPNTATIEWRDDNLTRHVVTTSSTNRRCNDNGRMDVASNEVSVETESSFTVEAYPNPVTDKFRISVNSPLTEDVSIDILNLYGQRVYSAKTKTNTLVEVDASAYVSGLYIIKARQLKSMQTVKIVKQ